ncbi:hypothetical protein ACIBQ1_26110 [Nonomuraea sp. NPDC050153]|uniref:hypothetical protein n=1 Tax=Nonomuraea sp. NPDC050153 TaxID=3364359 RepID=UPI0037B468A7
MPKSRGRRKATSSRPVRRSPLAPRRSDLLLRDARQLTGLADPLMAETWASGWLGGAWLTAELGEREAEHRLCMEVTGRASTTPSPHGLAVIAALARVAPVTDVTMLAETIDILAETQPLPPWHTAMSADTAWTAVAAWRAVDVWDSEQVLLIDYDGPHPHTLMAQILHPGGLMIGKLAILEPGAAAQWDQPLESDEVPMPISQAPVADVLADLADALRTTDITWPRNDDENFVDNRALAWSRCRDHLSAWPEREQLPEAERHRLIQQFTTANDLDDEVSRSLAELFLDYGEGHIISGPLAWSPAEVMLLLTDWLPRKAILDAAQRTALPDVLRQWLTYVLDQRGVDPRWITPVVDAVDVHLHEFRQAFDDHTSWGPAKQIAAALTDRGIDLTDRQAVDDAMRALNAERLAHRLLP